MSFTLIDGRSTRDSLIPGLLKQIEKLSYKPRLAILQVGDRADSTTFIRAKKIFAEKMGIDIEHLQVPETVSQADILSHIAKYNSRRDIHAIIVQLPLPVHIDRDTVIESIDPCKDADGLTSSSMKRFEEGQSGALIPATARGIRELLAHYRIGLTGKKVCVVGRSALVGTPVAQMCRNEGATVTVCHSKTIDLASETQKADILIVATGQPRLIRAQHVKPGQVVIDIGISKDQEKISGDVDFDTVKAIVAAISPVPGGVGPMTVFALFENVVDLCQN